MKELELPAFLQPNEIKQLTGKTKSTDQVSVLNKMRVKFMRRFDGEIIISRMHMEKMLDGLPQQAARKEAEPDYGAL